MACEKIWRISNLLKTFKVRTLSNSNANFITSLATAVQWANSGGQQRWMNAFVFYSQKWQTAQSTSWHRVSYQCPSQSTSHKTLCLQSYRKRQGCLSKTLEHSRVTVNNCKCHKSYQTRWHSSYTWIYVFVIRK